MQKNCLIVGFGNLAYSLAPKLLAQRYSVWGMSRQPKSADITPVLVDLDQSLTLDWSLPVNCQIFYLAPPPASGDSDPRMQRFLDWLDQQARPNKILYVSTTGVYGDCGGEWIDEQAAIRPESDRAIRRWAAEQMLSAWCGRHSVTQVVFRVAGIYGPRTLPIERARGGTVVVKPEQATFTNRIHIDDLAQACVVAMQHEKGVGVFNLADGHPSTMADYFNLLAQTFDLPTPEMIDAADAPHKLSAAMMSFLRESKRIRVDKLKTELGFRFTYPSLAEGMRACATSLSAADQSEA